MKKVLFFLCLGICLNSQARNLSGTNNQQTFVASCSEFKSTKVSFCKPGDNDPLLKYVAGRDTSSEWILQSDINGIKAYYRVSTCGVFPTVLIKFINSNAWAVTLSWENQLAIVGNSNPVSAGRKTFVVQPGEVSAATCYLAVYPELVVRYDANMPEDVIASFVFKNITVLP